MSRRLILASAVALAASVLTAQPASADIIGGAIWHNDPDAGFSAPVTVRFADGSLCKLKVGEHSDHCQPNGSEDVAKLYVHRCTNIAIKRTRGGWQDAWEGPHVSSPYRWKVYDIGNLTNKGVVVHLRSNCTPALGRD